MESVERVERVERVFRFFSVLSVSLSCFLSLSLSLSAGRLVCWLVNEFEADYEQVPRVDDFVVSVAAGTATRAVGRAQRGCEAKLGSDNAMYVAHTSSSCLALPPMVT